MSAILKNFMNLSKNAVTYGKTHIQIGNIVLKTPKKDGKK
jgi:hypothetical protein